MIWEIFLATSALFLFLYLYMLFMKHPKGYPPGPTGIPLFGYMPWLGKTPHLNIGKLGQKYGNIFSLQMGSLSMVVLNNLETVKAGLKLDTFAGRPNHILAMSLFKLGIVFSTGNVWREQRRFALKTLRDIGFGKKSMETMIQEEASELVQYLRLQVNRPIQFKEVFSISIVNSLWLMLTGEKFCLNDPKPRVLLKLGKECITEPNISGILYILPWLAKILPGKAGFGRVEESVRIMKSTMRQIIEQHQKTFVPGGDCNDFIDFYLQKMSETTDPESTFFKEAGIDNLVDSLVALFTGGQDTMACTMEYTILFLLTYPEVQRKIQKEIDRAIGRSRPPTLADRPKMPYLEAVMQESMRLSSVAPSAILHDTTEDVEFYGFNLPKGTIIMPNFYQIHHNQEYWKDPENFRPERFINEDGSFRKDENVLLFSIGKRVCPAENMSMVEYFLYLANFLQAFDIESDPNCPLPGFEASKPALVLSPNPYKTIFKLRQ